MKILVTGGAGFIGSHLVRRLLSEGHKIVIVDNFNDFYDPRVKEHNLVGLIGDSAVMLYRGDIMNDKILEQSFHEKPDAVIHLAALAGVVDSRERPILYGNLNILGTMRVLEACRKNGVKKFILASSSAVYGECDNAPFSENADSNSPVSIYGMTKKCNEVIAYTYHSLYKINCVCLRFFTVYGPAGRPDMAPFLFTRWIAEDSELKRYGDGNTVRDYAYIDDIIDGIVASLSLNSSYEIINLGSGTTITLNNFIAIIENHLGKKAKIKEYPLPDGDAKLTHADISKAKKLLGYAPKVTPEEGMRRFISWYKDHKYLYDAKINRSNTVL
jgi:UDP-glucuronate 4-epimerase